MRMLPVNYFIYYVTSKVLTYGSWAYSARLVFVEPIRGINWWTKWMFHFFKQCGIMTGTPPIILELFFVSWLKLTNRFDNSLSALSSRLAFHLFSLCFTKHCKRIVMYITNINIYTDFKSTKIGRNNETELQCAYLILDCWSTKIGAKDMISNVGNVVR